MSQLRQAYPEFQTHDTEVVVVSPTPPEKGAQYHQLFKFIHPYLCDPDHRADEVFGLPINRASVITGLLGGVLTGELWHHVRETPAEVDTPVPTVAINALRSGHVDAVFLIDDTGKVRFARSGFGMGTLPSNAEILRMLDELKTSG